MIPASNTFDPSAPVVLQKGVVNAILDEPFAYKWSGKQASAKLDPTSGVKFTRSNTTATSYNASAVSR